MQSLMPPVTTPDNLFHDGNPLTGEQGTVVTAKFLNDSQGAIRDTQSELLSLLVAAAINPDPAKTNQILTALTTIFLGRKSPLAELVADNTQSTARKNLGLGDLSTQQANNVSISGGTATLTSLNGQTVTAQTLNVLNTSIFSGSVAFTGQDYLNKNSVVNVPADTSNQTFGLRLTGSGGQRSDELFYEKIGTYAARRFVIISGGNTITYDMRQDGSLVCLNPVGTWQILPSGELYGPRWGGNLSDFISTWSRSNFMTDTRLGSVITLYKANNTNVFTCPGGYSFSSIDTGDVGTVTATARPIQKQINGNWITVSQL